MSIYYLGVYCSVSVVLTQSEINFIREADTTTSSLFTITYYFKALKAFLVKSEE